MARRRFNGGGGSLSVQEPEAGMKTAELAPVHGTLHR